MRLEKSKLRNGMQRSPKRLVIGQKYFLKISISIFIISIFAKPFLQFAQILIFETSRTEHQRRYLRILVVWWDGPSRCAEREEHLYIAFRIPGDGCRGGGVHRQPETFRNKEGCCFPLSSFLQAAPWLLQAAMPIPRVVANISTSQVGLPFIKSCFCVILKEYTQFRFQYVLPLGAGSMPKSGNYFLLEHRDGMIPDFCK